MCSGRQGPAEPCLRISSFTLRLLWLLTHQSVNKLQSASLFPAAPPQTAGGACASAAPRGCFRGRSLLVCFSVHLSLFQEQGKGAVSSSYRSLGGGGNDAFPGGASRTLRPADQEGGYF